jgi:hypothetical protein
LALRIGILMNQSPAKKWYYYPNVLIGYCLLIFIFFRMMRWKHPLIIIVFSTVFLTVFLNNVELSATQPGASMVSQNTTNLLAPPKSNGPIVVGVAFQLYGIEEIDDETETFQFTGVLTLTWKDERQVFDPIKEGVSEKIFQGDYQFNEISPSWYPQVVLVNEFGMYENHGVLLRVQPDGTSTLITKVNAIAKDKFNMRRYPFDTQQLDAVFEIFGFNSNEVVFKSMPVSDDSSWRKVRISQWELTGFSSSTGEYIPSYNGTKDASSTFTVTMEVRRNSFFVMRLVIIPLALIVMLSWSVFWMDRSSLGDRINVSFVGILTAVAYQIVVGGILPHISYVTLMNGFVNLSLFIMCATVVINLVVGAYDNRGKQAVGDLIDYRCRWIFPIVYFGMMLLFTIIAFVFFK